MNRIKQIVLVLSLLFSVVYGQEIQMDFRDSHRLEDIAGLESMKLFQNSEEGDKTYLAENVTISISFPSGQKVLTKAQSLKLQAQPDGTLRYIRMVGPIMPLDEVYEAGKKLYSAFSAPLDRIEEWKSQADLEGRSAKTLLGGNYEGIYPPVYINLIHGMNKLYPWAISLSFGWNQLENDQRNEAWGRENNPKPHPGLEVVSLEPPSGKTYDRADAWVEANRRQDELDKKLGQFRGPDGQLISEPKNLSTERPEKPRAAIIAKSNDVITEKIIPFPWWLILGFIAILVFSITVWLQRRNCK